MILYLNQDTRTDTVIYQTSQDSRSTLICRSVGKKNDVFENVDDPNPNPTDVYFHCPSRFTVLDVHVTSLYIYFMYHGGTIGVLIVKAYTFESPYHVWVKLSTRRKKIRIPATEIMLPAQCKHQEYMSNSFFAHHVVFKSPRSILNTYTEMPCFLWMSMTSCTSSYEPRKIPLRSWMLSGTTVSMRAMLLSTAWPPAVRKKLSVHYKCRQCWLEQNHRKAVSCMHPQPWIRCNEQSKASRRS
jgi:hypothetical protein